MKRYIRCNQLDTTIQVDIIKEFGRPDTGRGCSFISKDGEFINIYPTLSDHEDLSEYLEDKYNISGVSPEFFFQPDWNWVRLRRDPRFCIIQVPPKFPTKLQWYSLAEWINWCEEEGNYKIVIGSANTIGFAEAQLGKDVFTEDVIHALTRSYTTGRIVF